MIRIGLGIAICMLALIVAAGGSPAAPATRPPRIHQPMNLTLQFRMGEDLG